MSKPEQEERRVGRRKERWGHLIMAWQVRRAGISGVSVVWVDFDVGSCHLALALRRNRPTRKTGWPHASREPHGCRSLYRHMPFRIVRYRRGGVATSTQSPPKSTIVGPRGLSCLAWVLRWAGLGSAELSSYHMCPFFYLSPLPRLQKEVAVCFLSHVSPAASF